MRWFQKVNHYGDTCVRRQFLWFPVWLYNFGLNRIEVRWLEYATIEYEWRYTYAYGSRWAKLRFVEES
jgi:hypothetical protein